MNWYRILNNLGFRVFIVDSKTKWGFAPWLRKGDWVSSGNYWRFTGYKNKESKYDK